MSINRRISLVVALLYMVAAIWAGGLSLAWRLFLFLPFPFACIWFSDAMGQYSLPLRLTRPTPGGFVAFFGWIFLLAPVVLFLIWRK
jgi:hypothetical protein